MSTNIDAPQAPGAGATTEEWERYFAIIDRITKENPDHALLKGRLDGNPIQIRAPWDPSAARWLESTQGTGAQRWLEGIQKPRAEFKQAALKNNDGYKASMQKALAEDRFAKGMAKVDVEEAIATAVAVGAQGYANGAAAREAKYKRNTDAIKGRMSAVVASVRNMPAKTDADREARMLAMVKGAREAAKGT